MEVTGLPVSLMTSPRKEHGFQTRESDLRIQIITVFGSATWLSEHNIKKLAFDCKNKSEANSMIMHIDDSKGSLTIYNKIIQIVFETTTDRVPSSVNTILYGNIVKDNHDHDLSIQVRRVCKRYSYLNHGKLKYFFLLRAIPSNPYPLFESILFHP